MTLKKSCSLCYFSPRAAVAFSFAVGLLAALPAPAQFTPVEVNDFRNTIGSRVETATILGGDYGIGGGTYSSSGNNNGNVDLNISKFGGAGDIGDPKPLGNLGIGWQPRLQGSMGYLTATKDINNGLLKGDTTENKTFAIQFGGGARFWFDDHFSIAPTIMGMYGHSENTYTAHSAFATNPNNFALAKQLGLIDWSIDTWTIRPALNFQYVYTWHRTIITLSSDPTYFYTESFQSSAPDLNVSGNSVTWMNELDVDVPLGVNLFGHELRSGGFFSRTELYNGIQEGLKSDYMDEVHGRIVLDFLGDFWKVQWIGLGISHLWGDNFTGWSYGADIAFRF